MALYAVLCGADTWGDVAEWAEDNASWLRRYLVLAHGTPSHDTFGRVFRVLDAIGCQPEIAQKIVDQGGDYLLVVKDSQGQLARALRDFFTEADAGGFGIRPVSRYETVEKDHGRIETRRAVWVSHLD